MKVQYALVLAQLAAAANSLLLHQQQLANTQLQPEPSSPTLVSPECCVLNYYPLVFTSLTQSRLLLSLWAVWLLFHMLASGNCSAD